MKVTTITIVGGGTSAWMAAAYLYHNHPAISITVVFAQQPPVTLNSDPCFV